MSAYRISRPQPGDRVAVIGIGGFGHLALQVAKALGHVVIAITNSADKEKDARSFGADIVLSFSPSMKQNSEAMEGLRPKGRLVTTAASAEPIQADPVQMLFKQTSILGSAQNDPSDLREIVQLTAAGKVKSAVETYRIDEINSVLARLADGTVRHRAVLLHDA